MAKKLVKKSKTAKPKKKTNGDYEVGKNKPPKHTQFKKGQVANPLGAGANPEKRALKTLTDKTLAECISKVMTGTEEEALELLNHPDTSLGHKIILRAAIDAAEKGHYSKFNEILERVIGPVAQKLDMTTKGQPINSISKADVAAVKEVMKKVESEY